MSFFVHTMIRIEDRSLITDQGGFKDFASFMDFEGGELVTRQRGRTVTRLELNGRAFYLKRNRFDSRELMKTVLHLRWPAKNAVSEWKNILAVERLGIRTVIPIAMGEKRLFGLEVSSFILTEELYGAKPLEEVLKQELQEKLSPARRKWKQSIIEKVAEIAQSMHSSGMCHQDFYLGHFFLAPDDSLYLIDLQRVLHRSELPRRYIVKDLGQLNYSVDCVGNISRTDRMRFFLHYLGVKSLGAAEKNLARSIAAKTDRIARHTVKLLQRRRRRHELP
jgi:heptose I phosphotransferase